LYILCFYGKFVNLFLEEFQPISLNRSEDEIGKPDDFGNFNYSNIRGVDKLGFFSMPYPDRHFAPAFKIYVFYDTIASGWSGRCPVVVVLPDFNSVFGTFAIK